MKIHPLLVGLALLGAAATARPCTIIAAGKKATADGSVLLSHTDTGPDSRIRVIPGRSYPAGTLAPVYWGIQDPAQPLDHPAEILGYIPQVRQTFGYIRSAYSHINEHQLGIAESTTNQRPELVNEKDHCEQIMTIEMAQIFALERCRSARAAVHLIGELMTTWGFLCSAGDGSETLAIGDTGEVWIFEVFGVGPEWKKASGRPGAIWAAQRLGDDQATMVPNWSIIKRIDPADTLNYLLSGNWMSAAVERGWYDPAAGTPFIWQEVYAPLPQEFATGRFWLFYSTFMPHLYPWPDRSMGSDPFKGINPYMQYVEPLSIYPFSAKPEHLITVQEVIAFQRSVFEGTIYDITNDPNWLVPDNKGGYVKSPLATPFPGRDLRALLKLTNRRPVARHRGHYGMVLQLRGWLPDPVGGLYWVYLDNPYFSPYVPIYAGVTATAACYQTYDPEHYSDASARWTIDMVDNLANLKFQQAIADVRAVRDPWEAAIFARQDSIETAAVHLLAKNPQKARDFLTHYCTGLQEEVPAMYIGLRNTLITKYTNDRE